MLLGFYFGGLIVVVAWIYSDYIADNIPDEVIDMMRVRPLRMWPLLTLVILCWPISLPVGAARSVYAKHKERKERAAANAMRRCLGDEECDGPVVPGTTKCALHHAMEGMYD